MFLKPKSSLVKVPDPAQAGTPGYWLPAEGREVESSMYWQRRLMDGDVVLATQAPVATPAPVPSIELPPADVKPAA